MKLTLRILVMALALGTLVPALRAVAPHNHKDKLRRLAPLPMVHLKVGLDFSSQQGFTTLLNPDALREALEAARTATKDNPEEGSAHLRLAALLRQTGEEANSRRSFIRAAALLRAKTEARPHDGPLHAELSKALTALSKHDEAESLLRGLMRSTTNDWNCRLALGQLLDIQAGRLMQFYTSTTERAPVRGDLAQAERLLAEADECFDQAAALAPEEALVFLERALHRQTATEMQRHLATLRGEELPEKTELWPPGVLADFQKASQLSPTNYQAIGLAAWIETMNPLYLRSSDAASEEYPFDQLPATARQSVRAALTQLENLGQHPNPKLAAGALETLGLLQYAAIGDERGAEVSLRSAVKLDPARHQAWEALTGIAVNNERFEELIKWCEARLEQKETARNRLLLAKALDKAEQPERAMEEALRAVKLAPEEPGGYVAISALLLKHAKDPSFILLADRHLRRASDLIKKLPAGEAREQITTELALNHAIYYGLMNELETARQVVRRVLEKEPKNETAREILSALGH